MSAAGTWDAKIDSPIGKQTMTIVLAEEGGKLTGSASSNGEDLVLSNAVAFGTNQAKWSVAVSKPFKLSVEFTVTIDGDTFKGTAKPGHLPASKVEATRVA